MSPKDKLFAEAAALRLPTTDAAMLAWAVVHQADPAGMAAALRPLSAASRAFLKDQLVAGLAGLGWVKRRVAKATGQYAAVEAVIRVLDTLAVAREA